jgi:hypothetical protein
VYTAVLDFPQRVSALDLKQGLKNIFLLQTFQNKKKELQKFFMLCL